MSHPSKCAGVLILAGAIMAVPSFAASKRKAQASEDQGVQAAIRYQRAKDAADARQARLQARRPEHVTDTTHQGYPGGAAPQQQNAAREGTQPNSADRATPDQQRKQ
jgi:hypothetical protein